MTPQQAQQLTVKDFRGRAAALRPETRMLIDGRLIDSRSGKRFETVNPANGEIIATVPLGDEDHVDRAVASVRQAFKAGIWSRLEPRARMAVMYRFAELINAHAMELGSRHASAFYAR
jgi:acyl-CoA reductase-like NAD-dependent aldehyde dehydrogenase